MVQGPVHVVCCRKFCLPWCPRPTCHLPPPCGPSNDPRDLMDRSHMHSWTTCLAATPTQNAACPSLAVLPQRHLCLGRRRSRRAPSSAAAQKLARQQASAALGIQLRRNIPQVIPEHQDVQFSPPSRHRNVDHWETFHHEVDQCQPPIFSTSRFGGSQGVLVSWEHFFRREAQRCVQRGGFPRRQVRSCCLHRPPHAGCRRRRTTSQGQLTAMDARADALLLRENAFLRTLHPDVQQTVGPRSFLHASLCPLLWEPFQEVGFPGADAVADVDEQDGVLFGSDQEFYLSLLPKKNDPLQRRLSRPRLERKMSSNSGKFATFLSRPSNTYILTKICACVHPHAVANMPSFVCNSMFHRIICQSQNRFTRHGDPVAQGLHCRPRDASTTPRRLGATPQVPQHGWH